MQVVQEVEEVAHVVEETVEVGEVTKNEASKDSTVMEKKRDG